MILDQIVEMTMRGPAVSYYRAKGYNFRYGETIEVAITDLPHQSNKMIHVKCDYCNSEQLISYCTYNDNIKKHDGKYGCRLCAGPRIQESIIKKYGKSHMLVPEIIKKQKQTNMLRYGVEHAAQNADIKEKAKQTCIEKYGVKAATCNAQIREKVRKTTIERYGKEGVTTLPEFEEKRKATNLNKYGVEYVLQSKTVQEKSRQTMLNKYGVENCMQNKSIREKAQQTLYCNQSQQVSAQQLYLHELYQGELNYPCSYYSLDIYLPRYNLDIEYNGGGHTLQVKLGDITEEEFNQKEIIRSVQLKRQGVNQFTIISRKDWLPSDSILLRMLQDTISYLSSTNHHWVEFDIDNGTKRNATGMYSYNFGELRKIKKSDIEINDDTSKETP